MERLTSRLPAGEVIQGGREKHGGTVSADVRGRGLVKRRRSGASGGNIPGEGGEGGPQA